MIAPTETRGFLNRNPGNMDRGEPPWNGEIRNVADCVNDIQRVELMHGRFCVFTDAQHGIRAMVKNLRAYRDRLGCRTIRDYINRWAPPNENNTASYIAAVAHACAVRPDDPVDIEKRVVMTALVRAIIGVECAGMPYTGNEIDDGLTMAEVAPAVAGVAPARDLAIGMKGPDVKALQAALTIAHYYFADLDGDFGPKTEAAVKSLQLARRVLPANGIVGADTRTALGL